MRSLGFSLLAPFILLSACNDPESGTLTVDYQLGPGDSTACADFGIDRVRATLGEDEFVEDSTCGEPIVFSGLSVGKWDLLVEAVAADGTVVMDNEAEGARVEILGGAATDFEAQLTATPARVYVRWQTNISGFPAQCTDASVQTKQFQVQAWDDIGTLLAMETFDCADDTDDEYPTYRRVADPDRKIAGNLVREVSVKALDASGASLDPTARFMLDATPGPGRRLFLTVQCDDNACMSTGSSPWDMP